MKRLHILSLSAKLFVVKKTLPQSQEKTKDRIIPFLNESISLRFLEYYHLPSFGRFFFFLVKLVLVGWMFIIKWKMRTSKKGKLFQALFNLISKCGEACRSKILSPNLRIAKTKSKLNYNNPKKFTRCIKDNPEIVLFLAHAGEQKKLISLFH